VLNQLKGVGVVVAYDAVVSLIILGVVGAVIGVRVTPISSAKASTSPCTAKPYDKPNARPARVR
jgi:ammonia channel protein AmtB